MFSINVCMDFLLDMSLVEKKGKCTWIEFSNRFNTVAFKIIKGLIVLRVAWRVMG